MPFVRPSFIILAALSLMAASLPDKGPLPLQKPETEENTSGDTQPEAAITQDQDKVPTPEQKPEQEPKKDEPATATPEIADEPVATTPVEELVVEPEDEKQHAACLEALTKMTTVFKTADHIDDGKGCGIDKPITVSQVISGVKLQPEGTMRCQAALALARWTKDSVLPAATAAFPGETVTQLNQASAYICRLRNNAMSGKISEHARGNAVDVASFSLSGGKAVEIKPRREDATLSGAFQRSVTATACLYFATVLDPESDDAHENHLHLDVLQREGGYRYCR